MSRRRLHLSPLLSTFRRHFSTNTGDISAIVSGSGAGDCNLTPETLTPALLHLINQSTDPIHLLNFFSRAHSRMPKPPNLDSFSLLATHLFNSGHLHPAADIIERMISFYPSPSSVLNSLTGSNPRVLDLLVSAYKKKGLVKEAAEVGLLINELIAKEISGIVSGAGDWNIAVSGIADRITAENLSVVLRRVTEAVDAARVLDFFSWANSRIGRAPNLDSFAVVAAHLCNSGQIRPAGDVIEQMIRFYPSPSSVLDSLKGSNPRVLDLLVNAYKRKGLVKEAAEVGLLINERMGFRPNTDELTVALAREISGIIAGAGDWRLAMAHSDIADRITPKNLSSVLRHLTEKVDAARVSEFFSWANFRIGRPADLESSAVVAVHLCNSGLLGLAGGVIERMIAGHRISPSSVVNSVKDNAAEGSNPRVFDVLVDVYKKNGLVKEASEVVLLMNESKGFRPSIKCCNGLLKELLRSELMSLFWEVHDFMVRCKVGRDVFTFSILITAFFKIGDANSARRVPAEMREKGCEPNSVIYNTLIGGLCRSGNSEEGRSLLHEMSSLGMKPDVFVYTSLIDGFMREGNMDVAFKIRDEMVASGIQPNMVTYYNLIRRLCKIGKMDKAHEILKEMVRAGWNPDVVTLNFIIEGHFHEGKTQCAVQVFDEMKIGSLYPNVYTYSLMISGLSRVGELKRAVGLLEEMIGKGLEPNAFVYSPLILGHCREGMIEEACLLFNSINDRHALSDPHCYNSLINGLCKVGKMEEAKRYFEQMKERVISPNLFTYASLIHGHCDGGEMKEADSCLKEMIVQGLKPNIVIFTTLIDGHQKAGDCPMNLSTFQRILGGGVLPDLRMYSAFIHSLSKAGKMEEALQVFNELQGKGLNPDVYTYSSMIFGFCRVGYMEKALSFYTEMRKNGVKPSIFTYNALIDGFGKVEDFESVRKFFKCIQENGLEPTGITYATMINGFCKFGNLPEAFVLFDEMVMRGIPPDSFVYNALLHGCCRAGRLEKAMELVNEMLAKKFITELTFNTLIDGFCKQEKLQEARELLQLMLERKIMPNNVTYTALIDGHCRAGKLEEAQQLFSEMEKRNITANALTYTSLIYGYGRLRNFEMVSVLFKEMTSKGVVPDEVTYEVMIHAYGEEMNAAESIRSQDGSLLENAVEELSKARELVNEMKKRVINPDDSESLMLFHDLCTKGFINEAKQLLKIMVDKGWVPKSNAPYSSVDGSFQAIPAIEASYAS